MSAKGRMISAVLFTAMGLFVLGCAAGTVGILKEEPGQMTLDMLLRDWQNYTIYYGGTNPDRPIVVLFDPKNDGNKLVFEGRYWPISDEKAMRDAVGRINMLPGPIPRLWRILGPGDSLYGYAYTPLIKLNMTLVDQNTMRVMTF